MTIKHAAQFSQLFTEFRQSYLSGDGQFRLAAYIEIRSAAYANYQQIKEQAQSGADLTELVLLRLLPYNDSTNNRWHGAWTHVAPAVPSDIRKWYGTAGRISQDEWPTIAHAIWHFVHQVIESPDQLAHAAAEFSRNSATKGFQQGMLTPILNALRPDHFALINNRARQFLHYFTSTNYNTNLTDYPAANQAIYTFLADHSQSFDHPEMTSHPADLFECFAYWLSAVRRFPMRTPRYWLIDAGEEPWPWAEWKDGDFAALGWDELGDLAHIKRNEFNRRRESLLAQHPDWSKEEANQIWRFAKQLQEGDQMVAYVHPATMLGIGTVTGDYYYAVELPQGHRVPVQWDDLTPRHCTAEISAGVQAKLLQEIDQATFQQIQQAPRALPPPVTSQAEPPCPHFVEHFSPLLTTLRAATKKRAEGATMTEILPQLTATSLGAGEMAGDTQTGELSSGEQRAIYRARHYLAKAGLVESPRRGLWRVTAYGANISLEAAEMLRIYQEIEYQQQVEETLRHESPAMRRLAEGAAVYVTGVQNPTDPETPFGTEYLSATAKGPASQDRAEAIVEETGEETRERAHPAYSLAVCAAETGFSPELLTRWSQTLQRKKQVIFYGPSGTGKTFLAHHLARHITGGTDGFWELVQFHPAYAYEDFVQGIRPTPAASGSEFVMKPGRFLTFCERAAQVNGPAVLIIDEINRANLTRVFGELMYLLEYRGAEAIMAGSGKPFRIPENVFLIGTMNTADRSTAFMDHALRRRFAFVQLRPDYDLLRHYHARHATGFPVEGLIRQLVAINQSIRNPDQALGITYFMRATLQDELQDIWQLEIEPTLDEQFFDQPDVVERFRWQVVGGEIR